MNKKKIKLLPLEQLPEVIEVGQLTDNSNCKYFFVAKNHNVGGERVLAVTFFSLETRIAEFRLFFNQNNFLNEILTPQRKWSNATLGWMSDWYMRHSYAICANAKSEKLILKHFKAHGHTPYQAMVNFQKKLREKQLHTRHRKETDKIDERMRAVRALPRDFDKWVNEVALDFSRYIYYKRKTKCLIMGYCTSCTQTLELYTKDVPAVRHNEPGICMSCKKAITFKATGKTTRHCDHVNVAYIQATAEGFLVRSFSVKKRYHEHYRQPKLTVSELVRDFYAPNKDGKWSVTRFEFTNYKQTNVTRWCKSQNLFSLDTACLYTRNILQVLADTPWKHSGIHELAQNINCFKVSNYLGSYLEHPVYEYLVKSRLYRLVAESLRHSHNPCNLQFEEKSVHGILGIDRQRLNQMQKHNGTDSHLLILRRTAGANVMLSDEHLQKLVHMGVDGAIFVTLLGYTTPHKIIKYAEKCMAAWKTPKNGDVGWQQSYHGITEHWRDYIDNCMYLGYDITNDFVLFPNDLKAAHDNVMELANQHRALTRKKEREIELKANEKVIADMYDRLLAQFGFTHKDFTVIPPKSVGEIIDEGHKLRHCVGTGSYIKRIVSGEGFILFIRQIKNPDKPFFTAEVVDGKLQQCRGASNCDMTPEVKRFTERWKNEKLQRGA